MSIFRRIVNVFSRTKVEREIETELASHIEMRIEDNIAAGMSRREARRDALVRFGNPTTMKEKTRAADVALLLESIGSDVRYASRQLWKNPGFASTAIVVLALGLAASVAIFAFVDAALIKPLPYRDPSRLVALFESNPLGPRFHLSYLDYLDWKRLNKVFSSVEAYDYNNLLLSTVSGAQQARGATVSDGFFRMLGVAPALGRDFRAGEDLPSAPRTVLLSYSAWQTRYGGRSDVLGQTVTLNGLPNTIIGVLPKEFHFALVERAEFWITLHRPMTDDRGEHGMLAIARLKDDVAMPTAAADMSSIATQLARQFPDADAGRGATVVGLTEVMVGNFRPILLVLLSGAGLLLLIACVNVASLLLVRSESRRREIALRGVLGASRTRLTRQFVTEGVLLATIGCGLGLAAASVAMRLLAKLIPAGVMDSMPYLDGLGLNGRVISFACLLALGAAILFSLLPTIRLRHREASADLSDGGRSHAGTLWRRLGPNLVIVELATAVVLLVGAGLLGKSFYRLMHTDTGMQPDHLAMLRILAPETAYAKDEQVVALASQVVARMRSLPGVISVCYTQGLPLNGNGNSSVFKIVGRPKTITPDEEMVRAVSGSYFATLQARLLRGRYFAETEDQTRPRVVMVNQAMVRRYFPGEDPLGKRIQYEDSSPQMEVVGVVADIKEGPLDEVIRPVIYVPFAQDPNHSFFVVARTSGEERSFPPLMAAAIREIDPALITSGGDTMIGRMNTTQAAYLHRSSAWLVGGFAALALALAVVGLYGVIAYSVSQRTREIGVRMALGAQRTSVYTLVLKEAGWLTGIGIAAGLASSIAAANLMRSLLFGTQAWDISILACVASVLAAAALLASYLPAHRAASVNPVEALRAE